MFGLHLPPPPPPGQVRRAIEVSSMNRRNVNNFSHQAEIWVIFFYSLNLTIGIELAKPNLQRSIVLAKFSF